MTAMPEQAPTHICAVCGTQFPLQLRHWPGGTKLKPVKKQTCSAECASVLRVRNRGGGKQWTQAEREILMSLAGDHPLDTLTRIYNRRAMEQGFPRRTKIALRIRLHRDHGSVVPEYDGWGLKAFARLLGFTHTRVRRWIESGHLEAPMVGPRRVIRTRAIRVLARQRPYLLGGADFDGLAYVLDDPEWARQILNDHRRARTHARTVVRVEDGRRFRSTGSAAFAVGRDRSSLNHAIRSGGRCAGYHWRWADP